MAEEFGAVLKEWRNQRRHSQLGLSLEANISSRHLSFLESGRSRPSRSMALKLCEVLELPKQARNRMLSSAGFAPVYKSRDLTNDELKPAQEAVDWMLERHAPYPAVVMDKHWKALSFNKPAEILLMGMGVNIGDNLSTVLVENELLYQSLLNPQEVIHHLIMRLRTESQHYGGDAVLDGAICQLEKRAKTHDHSRADAGFSDPLPAFLATRYKFNGEALSFFSTFTQFGSAEDITLSELKVEMMFPADDLTRNVLAALS